MNRLYTSLSKGFTGMPQMWMLPQFQSSLVSLALYDILSYSCVYKYRACSYYLHQTAVSSLMLYSLRRQHCIAILVQEVVISTIAYYFQKMAYHVERIILLFVWFELFFLLGLESGVFDPKTIIQNPSCHEIYVTSSLSVCVMWLGTGGEIIAVSHGCGIKLQYLMTSLV